MPAPNTKTSIRGKRKKLLDVLLNAENEGVLEICEKAGIAVSTYYKYVKDEKFRNMINDNIVIGCVVKKPKILRALSKQAEKGSIPAIRTFLEFDGSLRQGSQQTVNVGVSNEGAQVIEPDDIKDDNEALAIIEQERAQLDAWEQAIKARQAGTNRLKDGIHPQDKGTGAEEA
jgi:hypothetical protein